MNENTLINILAAATTLIIVGVVFVISTVYMVLFNYIAAAIILVIGAIMITNGVMLRSAFIKEWHELMGES